MGISDLAIGAPRYCFSTQDYNEAKYGEDYKNKSSINNFLENNKEKQIEERDIKNQYIIMIMMIEHTTLIPIKIAVEKFIAQINKINNYLYTQKIIINDYDKVLLIQKNKNKWMCSKERLDFIDFTKLENTHMLSFYNERNTWIDLLKK